MIYKVVLTYNDEKTVTLMLPQEELPCLFKHIKKSSIYYNEFTGVAFWTSMEYLRHIIVHPHKENTDESKPQDNSGCDPVQSGNENTE